MNNKIVTIGIDGNEANAAHRVGVGQYVFELLKQFKKAQGSPVERDPASREKFPAEGGSASGGKVQSHFKNDTQIQWRIYLKEPPLPDMPEESENWRYKVFGPTKLWTRIALPLRLWQEKKTGEAPDVFFSPNHYAPLFCPVPSVISVMDLAFFRFPRMFKSLDLWQLKSWTAYSAKRAKKILAISEATKNDVVNFFGEKAEDVIITYPGYDKERFDVKIRKSLPAGRQEKSPAGRDPALREKIKNTLGKYKISEPYILYLGTLQPRKNLVRLIEAFALVRKKYPRLELVIAGMINVGRGGWMYENIFAKVKELNIEKAVIFTNYVPDVEIPALMVGAKAYVLVSLFEGFGMPVVEAMAMGTPVVISRVSSLPEIGGKVAVYVDPRSIESIKNGIIEVLENSPGREKLIARAKSFSWEKCAKETLTVLFEVINGNYSSKNFCFRSGGSDN